MTRATPDCTHFSLSSSILLKRFFLNYLKSWLGKYYSLLFEVLKSKVHFLEEADDDDDDSLLSL